MFDDSGNYYNMSVYKYDNSNNIYNNSHELLFNDGIFSIIGNYFDNINTTYLGNFGTYQQYTSGIYIIDSQGNTIMSGQIFINLYTNDSIQINGSEMNYNSNLYSIYYQGNNPNDLNIINSIFNNSTDQPFDSGNQNNYTINSGFISHYNNYTLLSDFNQNIDISGLSHSKTFEIQRVSVFQMNR